MADASIMHEEHIHRQEHSHAHSHHATDTHTPHYNARDRSSTLWVT